MSQNLSSAAVVIGALRDNVEFTYCFKFFLYVFFQNYMFPFKVGCHVVDCQSKTNQEDPPMTMQVTCSGIWTRG